MFAIESGVRSGSIGSGAQKTYLNELEMLGDILLGAHKLKTTNLLLKESASAYMGIRNIGDSANRGLMASYVYATSQLQVDDIKKYGVATQIWDLKTFTTAPALADMDIGEIAMGDGTGGGGEDEWFFKPDAGKIIAVQVTGTTITARSIT